MPDKHSKSAEQKKNFDKEDDDAQSTTDPGPSIELMIDDPDDDERDDDDDDAPWLDDPLDVELTGNTQISIDDDIDIENTFLQKLLVGGDETKSAATDSKGKGRAMELENADIGLEQIDNNFDASKSDWSFDWNNQ